MFILIFLQDVSSLTRCKRIENHSIMYNYVTAFKVMHFKYYYSLYPYFGIVLVIISSSGFCVHINLPTGCIESYSAGVVWGPNLENEIARMPCSEADLRLR